MCGGSNKVTIGSKILNFGPEIIFDGINLKKSRGNPASKNNSRFHIESDSQSIPYPCGGKSPMFCVLFWIIYLFMEV